MTNENVVEFSKYAIKQILIATNALEPKGSGFVFTLGHTALGIQPGATYTTQEAAVDAVFLALETQWRKGVAA